LTNLKWGPYIRNTF